MYEVVRSCDPECGPIVIQLPNGMPLGSVNAQSNLPTNANPGDSWWVMTPAPPTLWVWNGSAWVEVEA